MNEPNLYCRLRNGIKDFYFFSDFEKRVPVVKWFWGPTGSGKTRKAMESDSVCLMGGLPWFDEYNDEETVIFDDFRRESLKFSLFLIYIDRYCKRVPIKGGFRKWNPAVIIITCPRMP